jgi:hypothetical protein
MTRIDWNLVEASLGWDRRLWVGVLGKIYKVPEYRSARLPRRRQNRRQNQHLHSESSGRSNQHRLPPPNPPSLLPLPGHSSRTHIDDDDQSHQARKLQHSLSLSLSLSLSPLIERRNGRRGGEPDLKPEEREKKRGALIGTSSISTIGSNTAKLSLPHWQPLSLPFFSLFFPGCKQNS